MSLLNLKTFDFNETPSQAGKTYLITGGASCLSWLHLALLPRLILTLERPGTGGLGAQSVVSLANHPSPPAHIFFSGRSAARAEEVIAKCPSSVQVTFLQADLASPVSVKEAAQEFLQNESKLDVLLLNAGIMAVPFELNKEGVEIQFATNHVGHALVSPSLPPLSSSQLHFLTISCGLCSSFDSSCQPYSPHPTLGLFHSLPRATLSRQSPASTRPRWTNPSRAYSDKTGGRTAEPSSRTSSTDKRLLDGTLS